MRVSGVDGTRVDKRNAPSTAFDGSPPPLRRGGTGLAAGRDVDPPPFAREGDHVKRGGGGADRARYP
jgi:hypothetical protein